jgi:hypothetical protein
MAVHSAAHLAGAGSEFWERQSLRLRPSQPFSLLACPYVLRHVTIHYVVESDSRHWSKGAKTKPDFGARRQNQAERAPVAVESCCMTLAVSR